ncbi:MULTISPECIES: hypothetical protein [Staphylococcus]|uniref:hypothetical protein n=1 Tax=Staphylococcus TaxID=1279 RepID=UPI000952CC91|nr:MULTISPECIES: hypothetical protein [Staphylococcus]MBE9429501.1 hypothetical protein [Staphylococcus epidermidis]AXV43280.1 hypothetical protein Ssp1_22930 [Staphylococcus sp. M0911]OLS07453.1 hypothetical protein AUK68_04905 [Staphylococcus epidermidis]PTI21550.1 hypothetical protein BU082_00140 [Staphylococcus warneri]PTI23704.1 hypothetical protein BU081_07300 [Staphylococcus warneri]
MLTKEFAQRVELSEKQVRKIVQHLEERGYQLSKTEYRGREATDFKEEDIELFKDIADKVKQTNSYDLAFEELEKEKDFLQVLVKEDNSQLPTDQNISQLVEDLRSEIQKMREERQMLGQMISQVHHQQQELKELQNQITSKIDANTESLKAIQTTQDAIQSTQQSHTKKLDEQQAIASESSASHQSSQSHQPKQYTSPSSSESNSVASTSTSTSHHSNSLSNVDEATKSESTSLSTSEQSTSHTTSESQVTNNHTESQSSPLGHPEPKEEKKGFFARLFNL